MLGLEPEEVDFLLSKVVLPLEAAGAEVGCFGSRATGSHHKWSDIDLLIMHDNARIRSTISRLNEYLEDSRFPYKVDLVPEADLAESYRGSVMAALRRLSAQHMDARDGQS